MARIAGRNGSLYLALTSGGTAEPAAFIKSWSIDFATGRYKVTAMGDSGEVYVAGLPDAKGDFAGFYDNSTVQMYQAAVDGVARKFYLYPDRSGTPGQYFLGTAFFDLSIDGDVEGPVAVKGSWNAATAVSKVG